MMNAGWNFEHSYCDLPALFFTEVSPTAVKQPQFVAFNHALAQHMGLNAAALQANDSAFYFAGNTLFPGSKPFAQAYAGHQFGHFTLLGDGRAILLGEHLTPAGQRLDVQLKGAGRTPYSRRGDGRAALGPMLREFIISEAMHALGIPTTRSLAVVTTGEFVMRDRPLPGAILTRVAQSHIRVGTFELAAAYENPEELAALTLYTLERHFPDFPEDVPPALSLLNNVVQRQAQLISQWMQVGFIHGVMNTDNMALSGETIDYGPCAFLDAYHPMKVFSSIDEQGRYAFANQAKIALWNLERFAETLLPLLHEEQEAAVSMAQDALDLFAEEFNAHWLAGMSHKLGLAQQHAEARTVVTQLLSLMQKHAWDYTNTFAGLTVLAEGGFALAAAETPAAQAANAPGAQNTPVAEKHPNEPDFSLPEFSTWKAQWIALLQKENRTAQQVAQQMAHKNPTVIPRNHRVEEALKAAELKGDYAPFERLLAVVRSPFARSAEHTEFSRLPAEHEQVRATFCGT